MIKYFFRIRLMLLTVLFGGICQGQNAPVVFDKKKLLPTSPEAAMISKFGDIPIGYYTGTANISIPFYTIKEGGIEIPVVLRYHSSGIKVEEDATWVGLGWSLDPGGAIIQNIVGKNDVYDNTVTTPGYAFLKSRQTMGTYNFNHELGQKTWDCKSDPYGPHCPFSPGANGDEPGAVNSVLEGGGQPDIYQYSFAGYSGKFYINPETQQIVQMDKSSHLVFVRSGLQSWTVTTLDGNKFVFDATEISAAESVTNAGYTWKLTQVILTNHKTIDFSYVDGHYYGSVAHQDWHSDYEFNLNGPNGAESGIFSATEHTTKTLTGISTDEVTINFILEDREDIKSDPLHKSKRLKSIDIVSKLTGKKIKSYNFGYSYFPYYLPVPVGGYVYEYSAAQITELDFVGKRLKLDNIQEVGYGENETPVTDIPPYEFSYDQNNTFPLKTSFAKDFWGYFNGKDNTSLLPDLSYFYYSGIRPNPPFSLPDLTAIPYPGRLTYNRADRITDNAKASTGILKRIKYPTGGYTELDYEPNSFSKYIFPDQAKIAVSHKQFSVIDHNLSSEQTAQQFTLIKSSIVRFNVSVIDGYPVETPAPISYNQMRDVSNGAAETNVTLLKVNFPGGANTTPSFTILKTWSLATVLQHDYEVNHGAQWNEDVTVEYDPDPNCYFLVSVNLNNNIEPQGSSTKVAYARCDFNYYDQAGIDQTSQQCGLRVSGIRNYTAEGSIASHKQVKYINEDGSTSGKLSSPLILLYRKHLWFETSGVNSSSCADMQSIDNPNVYFVSSDSYTGGGATVGYSRVEEIDLAPDGSANGKHIYNFINEEDQSIINVPNIPYLKNGLVSSEQILNRNGDLLKENSTSYINNYNPPPYFSGVKIFSNWIGLDQCEGINVNSTQSPDFKYDIYYYPLNAEWNLPYIKTSKEKDAQGNVLQTSEKYFYNALGQLIKTETQNSKGETVAHTTLYPVDQIPSSWEATALINNNNYNEPLEQQTNVEGVEKTKRRFVYNYINDQDPNPILVNTMIQSSTNQHQFFTDILFDKYGANKNLLQFTQQGLTSALIWSDNNSYVIAEISNAAVTDVAFTSFEPNEKGQWSYSTGAISNTAAPAGKQVFELGTTISKDGLNASKTYTVSYWKNSGSGPCTVPGTQGTPKTGHTIGGWTYYEHTVSGVTAVNVSGSSGLIDELRLYPSAAQMTSYTYEPLQGVATKCDLNNIITRFEYDNFNRLKIIRDQEYNIIKKIEYQYHQ